MTNYLRNRPFLVISYTFVPKEGQNTSAPNFGQTAEYDAIENMVIVDRVNTKLMNRAYLVLDLFENKVIKNRESDIDPQKVFDFMCQRYRGEIKSSLLEWIKRDPLNRERVNAFVDRFKKEADHGESNTD